MRDYRAVATVVFHGNQDAFHTILPWTSENITLREFLPEGCLSVLVLSKRQHSTYSQQYSCCPRFNNPPRGTGYLYRESPCKFQNKVILYGVKKLRSKSQIPISSLEIFCPSFDGVKNTVISHEFYGGGGLTAPRVIKFALF